MRDVLTEYQEEPISLAREALRVGAGKTEQAVPTSELEGGVAQFLADLEYDLPS
jgi:hypothetical protein